MIGALFQFASEVVEVRVTDTEVYFRSASNVTWATIEGIQLNYHGAVKEFPELSGDPDWKLKVIARFKKKIKELNNEDERIDYVIDDLKKHGYIGMHKQKKGFRPQKIG